MSQRLISQPILPLAGTADISAMTRGEPGLPAGFVWNKQEFRIREKLEAHKSYGNDHTHGSDEKYLQKHWYELAMDDDTVWKVYFDRYAKRWWLHSILTSI